MERMIVTNAFDGEDKGEEKHFPKGDRITVTNERADQLRERGLARKEPTSSKDGGAEDEENVADEAEALADPADTSDKETSAKTAG